MALTPKQKLFCDEYLIDCNATQAAIRAGYSEKTAGAIGEQNLKKLEIKSYIDDRMKEKQSGLIADQDEILQYLTSVIRGESVSEELVVEATGNGYSEARPVDKAPSEKDKLKAAELLGKRYGLYSEKVDVSMQTPVVIMGYEDIKE